MQRNVEPVGNAYIMEQSRQNSGLLLLGVGAAAFFGYKILKKNVIEPKQLQAYTTRLRVNVPAMRFKGDNVEFDMYIQNPNPRPLIINAVVGDVFVAYGGKNIKLGNVDRYGKVVIKPLGETKYTFAIRLKLLPLVAYFNDILAGKAKGQAATFKGTITINGRPWPITERIKIS